MAPGGKAGNQACQCALAGAEASILTRLGDDAFGRDLKAALAGRGVDLSLVAIDPEMATGASTVLAGEGDYQSIIAPGAAGRLSSADIARARAGDPRRGCADPPARDRARHLGRGGGDRRRSRAPGRAQRLARAGRLGDPARSASAATGLLVVNRVEAGRLLGGATDGRRISRRRSPARTGVGRVVVTEGGDGVSGHADGATVRVPAFRGRGGRHRRCRRRLPRHGGDGAARRPAVRRGASAGRGGRRHRRVAARRLRRAAGPRPRWTPSLRGGG